MTALPLAIQKGFVRFFRTYTRSLKSLRVLGIESSCDDTAAAVVDSDGNILGESKLSQSHIHAMHGGILPNISETLHKANIKTVVKDALEKSNFEIQQLDAIAVTVRPGIICNLLIGLEYAKDLCALHSKPLIPIHHMEAHALTVRLFENVEFPFLVLLISGGHCILAVAESLTKYKILGETLDITPGLFFDKIARRLKLSNLRDFNTLSGGVALEKAAAGGNPLAMDFKRLNRAVRDCNFSFSGYKTYIKRYITEREEKLDIEVDELLPNFQDICASIQFGMTRFICQRVEIGINYLNAKKTFEGKEKILVVSGGVASNDFIRKMLAHVCDAYNYKFVAPPKSLCTDNGVMVAWNGIEKLRCNLSLVPPNNLASVTCNGRSPLGETVNDVKDLNWNGKYVQLRKFIEKTSDTEESINSEHKKDIQNYTGI